MRIRRSFVRRWLLYGSLVSFLHLCANGIFGLITDQFDYVSDWLSLPGSWFLQIFQDEMLPLVPSPFESFYEQHMGWFVAISGLGNSALWGFTIAGVILYIFQRSAVPHPHHENAL